jgi:uncharacterized protein (TIGR02145 family)
MAEYHIAPASENGDDVHDGSISTPWLSINKFEDYAAPGDTLYLHGAVSFDYTEQQTIDVSGTSGSHITIRNYIGEAPVLDFSGHSDTGMKSGLRFENVSYVDLKGFRVTGVYQHESPTNGVYGVLLRQNVDNCKFEQIESDHIGGWAFALYASCSNVTFLNCDAHHCADPYSTVPFDGSDGFNCGSTGNTGIVFDGCRSWLNSDDGWDLRVSGNEFTIKNCLAFWNGYDHTSVTLPYNVSTWDKVGNGVGFKLEGATGNWKLQNSLAFENAGAATDNVNESGLNGIDLLEVYNCIFYKNNEGINYEYNIPAILRNNISFDNVLSDFKDCAENTHDHNDFDDGPTASVTDFVSVNSSGMDDARQANGDLPAKNFLHLLANSPLRGAGLAVTGLTTDGEGKTWNDPPSLGAYEYGSSVPQIDVTGITLLGAGNATTISTDNGTLQIIETVLPTNATDKDVMWSVINGTGTAFVSITGLLTAVSDGTVVVRATSASQLTIYGEIEITISNQTTDSLISVVKSCWEFNEASGDAIDVKGLQNLIPYNILQNQTGILNGAYSFDGLNSYVGEVDTLYELQTISIWAWFKTSSTGSYKSLMSNYHYQVDEQGYDFIINNQNKIEWATRNSISEYSIIESSTLVCDDAWHLALVTFDGTYQKIYVDSVLESTSSAWSYPITYHANSRFQIGVRQGDLYFDGLMDQCGICEGVLTQDQVDIIWNNGDGIEYPFIPIIDVTTITVAGAGSATTIGTDNGTLQMSAHIDPHDATNPVVVWSVFAGTGLATINGSGLLTAVSDGTVTVRATSTDGSGVYGELVITISNQVITYKNIAPTGWHVWTNAEITSIITALGGSSVAGCHLKEVGYDHWYEPNEGADNSSGFAALGGGFRFSNGNYSDLKYAGWFHSSDDYQNYGTYGLILAFDLAVAVGLSLTDNAEEVKKYGQSVRCIKNSTILTEGQTGTVTDIDGNIYPTKVIAGMEIMTANLKVTRFNDGTPIDLVTGNAAWAARTKAAYCWYNNIVE